MPGPRRLRIPFAERWGLPTRSTFAQIPERVFELTVELGLNTGHFAVLMGVIHRWRAENGNVFPCPLSALETIVPLDRAHIGRVLWDLNERGLLGCFAEPGKTRSVDITPLLRLVSLRTIALAQQPGSKAKNGAPLLHPNHELLRQRNSTVAPTSGTVASSASNVDHQSQRKDLESERATPSLVGQSPDVVARRPGESDAEFTARRKAELDAQIRRLPPDTPAAQA